MTKAGSYTYPLVRVRTSGSELSIALFVQINRVALLVQSRRWDWAAVALVASTLAV